MTDPNMVIEGECNGEEGEDLGKRVYLPGVVIRSKCPECGSPYVKDLGESYLSYPRVGVPYRLTGYCQECNHEWEMGSVVVGLTLTMAEGA